MESIRRPSGRRVLLPYEVNLCESLGITAEDYWEFIFAAQETLKERGEEFAHIPDVKNDPVNIVVNLVIGVALSAVGALLAPKPQQPKRKDPKRLDIAGSRGRTRYTKSNNFDSIQQLANLGEIIPLIFAERRGDYGGVRVETDMLYSQMLSDGSNQTLYALMTFGMGNLAQKPNFNAYALGDLLLRDFADNKCRLYFSQGEAANDFKHRIKDSDAYSQTKLDVPDHTDAFSLYWPSSHEWEPYFSGTRTPTTKTQFGCYRPIPNGHRFYVPLELVMVIDFSGEQTKKDSRKKRDKIRRPYPSLCGIVSQNGKNIVYKINSKQIDDDPDFARPWGLSDVISTQNERRIEVDEHLQVNQELMVGTVVGRVVSRDQDNVWAPEETTDFTYNIKLDENVEVPFANGGNLEDASKDNGGAFPWDRPVVQHVSIAALTNNRPCHATQIGIRSEVWRQLTGAINKNGFPTEDTIEDYEKDGGQITVGSITKYIKRYSFFTVYARELGAEDWLDITGEQPFAVRGTSPIAQYNTIHIDHPGNKESVHEFKIVPVPGAKFYDQWNAGLDVKVKLLEGSEFHDNTDRPYKKNEYRIWFTGSKTTISPREANNSEWYLHTTEGNDAGADFDDTPTYSAMIRAGSNYFPLNAACDYFINTTDTSSHADGPEHTVVFCNEILKQTTGVGSGIPRYKNLSLCGIKITNSREWTSFNNLSAWLAKGIEVEHLITGNGRGERGASNLFPEIAYALLTDDLIGAGKLIGAASVDRRAMKEAARFCEANNFFWDGVLAEGVNLREFIFENAGYILCDFTIKGGKFALLPSVPVNSNYEIDKKGKPDIRALFTDGNIRDMKVTFLPPEQRQPFKAVMLYRQEKENGFAENRTMTIQLKGSEHDSDPIEEFDMSAFCTSETQARWFGRVALKLREKVDHGITFETTPQSAMNLEPGQYFKVASHVTHTDRFQSGSVDPDGAVISSDASDVGVFQVVVWKPGETSTQQETLVFEDGKTKQSKLFGCLWARIQETQNTRVYKVETLSYADDGLVSVAGSFVPLTSSGTMAILDWSADDFEEEVA